MRKKTWPPFAPLCGQVQSLNHAAVFLCELCGFVSLTGVGFDSKIEDEDNGMHITVGGAMKLTEQKSKPILKGAMPLSQSEVKELMQQIPQWSPDERTIGREFRFKDFRETMEFVNRVAAIANEEDHHPDLFISYNKVQVTLSTHKIQGLSMNDFIVAAKIDDLTNRQQREQAA